MFITGLWGVINNAGLMRAVGRVEWLTLKDYHEVADVNLYGTINVTMAFLPLIKKEQGRLVTVSSICGRMSFQHFVPYCVTKYGLEAFMDGLR